MSDQGPEIKVSRRTYTVIWDDLFVEGQSARSWGVFCYLMSRPPGWVARANHLQKVFKEGRDALRAAMVECVEVGQLTKETFFDGNLKRERFVLDEDALNDNPRMRSRRSAPETDSQRLENPRAEAPRAENAPVVSTDVPTTEGTITAAAVASAGRLAATVVASTGTTGTEVDLFGGAADSEPDADAERRRTVRTLVAAYVDVVTARGGQCTGSLLDSIGKNVKRVVEKDGIPEGVLLVAVRAAAAKGARSIDSILAAPDGPQASWDRSPAARRTMQQGWIEMGRKLDAARGTGAA